MPVVHLGGSRAPITWSRRQRRRAACAGRLRGYGTRCGAEQPCAANDPRSGI